MSSTAVPAPARRAAAGQRSDRVDALVDAAMTELRQHGYDGLTVRNVARRAQVSPASAYTYFASKDHLVAEVFWRRLQRLPAPPSSGSLGERLSCALANLSLLIAEEPALAAASTTAVLAADPNVDRLRGRIGAAFNDYLASALGASANPAVLRTLNLALAGALLQAGMGYFTYSELADRMDEVAVLVLRGAA
ncbi:MAG: TetR/AcrR family transcriptional regulator [Acidimicrobiia bacterium]|nr:TetR/AcrR family transcriptional regulator [Acidimicrobiia bacterium]